MAGLAELERVKRRRLQEAYADLRPGSKRDDERQAKLRNLLLGAAADAGVSAPGAAIRAGGSSSGSPQAVRALAAAAAASIASVENSPGGRTGSRRGLLGSPLTGGAGGAGASAGGGGVSPQLGPSSAARSSPAGRTYSHSPGHGPHGHGGGAAASTTWQRHLDGAVAARAPPPGPMEGGFLQEVDPIQRLSRLQPAAVINNPGDGGGGAWAPGGAAAGPGGGGGARAAAPAAAATPRYGGVSRQDEEDEEYGDLDMPSDVELALIALRTDLLSHPGCSDLPPLALRSQLSCMLADRSTVERQLDEQRRANRVRVFKLPTGADEFGLLTTPDYRGVVLQAADATAASAASTHPAEHVASQQRRAQAAGAYGSEQAADGGRGGSCAGHSPWHAAAEAFLRRVVDRFTEFQLSHDHLVHLLRTVTQQGQPQPQPQSQSQTQTASQRQRQGDAAAAPAGPAVEEVEEQISLLLHLGCIARHTDGDADAYVMAVPGAGKLVKAVLGGRRELLAWLAKRQHHEAPEEQICKLKLRSSCLPPLFHVRDLVGRGAAKRLESTAGAMVRLPAKRPGAGT